MPTQHSQAVFFVQLAGKELGPFTSQELLTLAREGKLTPSEKVKKGPNGKWVEARCIRGLFDAPGSGRSGLRFPRSPVAIVVLVLACVVGGSFAICVGTMIIGLIGASRDAARELQAEQADSAEGHPNVHGPLAELFEGEDPFGGGGRYTREQREAVFARDYQDKMFLVVGNVTDISSEQGKRFLTVQVGSENYFDVYPIRDIGLLEYDRNSTVRFVGRWSLLGSGIITHHRLDEAIEVDADGVALHTEPDVPD